MYKYCVCFDDGKLLHAIKLENNYYDAVICACFYSTKYNITCMVIDLEMGCSVYKCS